MRLRVAWRRTGGATACEKPSKNIYKENIRDYFRARIKKTLYAIFLAQIIRRRRPPWRLKFIKFFCFNVKLEAILYG
jgi:hypothetical protein